MLGDGSCRLLVYILGYLAPAYSCFKALEQKQVDKTGEWCIYWLLLALFTTVERLLLDWVVFWIPLYYEAKVLFIIYLWHPKTKGAQFLYSAYVQPFLAGHEATIDQYAQEAKTWVSDLFVTHFQRLTGRLQSTVHFAIAGLQNLQQAKIEDKTGGGGGVQRRSPPARSPSKPRQRKASVDDPPPSHPRDAT